MPARRRIGVNALYLIPGGVGGTEIYLRNLLEALSQIDNRNEYIVFTNKETGDGLTPRRPNFRTVVSRVPARIRSLRLVWEQTGLALQTLRHKLDVLFSPGFTSPLWSRGGKVSVIHDLQHKRQPRNFGWIERRAWNLSVWASARYSDRLLTVSENSRRDIAQAYELPPERIQVVRHGVEHEFFHLRDNAGYDVSLLRNAGVPECRYLLAVSTLHPHKNWFRLLEAFRKLNGEGRELHLVVSGLRGKAAKRIEKQIKAGDLESCVHLLGWQPREVLLALFKYAEALVFPSTFEGFGMPVLEAMAAELPVVCSDIPPLRELADGAALFFPPDSTEELTQQIRQVLDDERRRERLVGYGLERASQFSWTHAAERTLAILLDAARN